MERCPHCGQTHGPDNHFCGVTGQPLDLGPRLLGQVLLDRFEVKSLVGEGPVAVVLGGIDRQAGGRPVAIKMLHPRFARDAAATERFLAEARRVGELGHPGLAPVYAVGRDPGGAPLVVREFLAGVCLARLVRERGPLPVDLATYIVCSILDALQAVHAAGLYNGDLTADDVFLTAGADGALLVKVLDFGEAPLKRALVAGGLAGPEATRWWAPEQKRSGIVSDRSDIFAVGALLYLAVTGKAPYPDGIPPAPAVIAIPENPSALVPTVNRKIDIVVRRAMSLLPTDRYPSATAFREALAPFTPPVPPRFAETAGAPAKVVAAPAVLPVGVQPPAASGSAPAAAQPRPSPKATLIGAPLLVPPGAKPAAPAASVAAVPGAPSAPAPGAAAPTPAPVAPAPAAPVAPPAPAAVVLTPATVAAAPGAPSALAPREEAAPAPPVPSAQAEEATEPATATASAAAPFPAPAPAPAPAATVPVVIPSPGADQDTATAATLQMPVMPDAGGPAMPRKDGSKAPFPIGEPARESKAGKVLALGIVALAVVAVAVALIWFLRGEEATESGAGGPARPADAAEPVAADAGTPAPADVAEPIAADAGTPAPADAAPEGAEETVAPAAAAAEAGAAETAEEAAAEAATPAEPDAVPEDAFPTADDAGAPEAALDVPSPVGDAGRTETAAPTPDVAPARDAAPLRDAVPARDAAPLRDAVPARDAAPLRDAVPARDAAPLRDAVPARDAARPTRDAAGPRDAGTGPDGRRGVVRDLDL